jgi:hypothetical protein
MNDLTVSIDLLNVVDYYDKTNNVRGGIMNCVAETIAKMIDSLPEHLQKKLLEEITPIIFKALDEAKWEAQFKRGSFRLVEIADEVKGRLFRGVPNPWIFRSYDHLSM